MNEELVHSAFETVANSQAFQADDAAIRSMTGTLFPSFGTIDEGKIGEHITA
jgi:hypothetical protein